MDDREYPYFLSQVGETFCETFSAEPGYELAFPHDFHEVLWAALGEPLTPELLDDARTEEGLTQIADACRRLFEVEAPQWRIARALEVSLNHWPAEPLDRAA